MKYIRDAKGKTIQSIHMERKHISYIFDDGTFSVTKLDVNDCPLTKDGHVISCSDFELEDLSPRLLLELHILEEDECKGFQRLLDEYNQVLDSLSLLEEGVEKSARLWEISCDVYPGMKETVLAVQTDFNKRYYELKERAVNPYDMFR